MSGYGRAEALVSTEWLAANLGAPDVRVVDASFKLPGVTPTAAADYAARHIPGAPFFDIEAVKDPANPLPHMLPDEASFANSVGALGLGNEHHIIVYDGAGLLSAPRVWWMLRVFGHGRVAILDGGLPKWLAEGRPVTAVVPRPAPVPFTAHLDRGRIRDKAALLANLTSHAEQVVDARSAARFAGTAPEPRAGLRSGHIPGSLSLPSDRFTDPERRTVLPPAALEALLKNAGLDAQKPTVCTCGSGVSACVIAFAMHLVGWPEAAIYDGSWSEWGLPGETPVATGV